MDMSWIEYIPPILVGLATCIPLVVKLIQYVQKAVQEKNWTNMLNLLMDLMEEAETKFETGADKKEWVLAMMKAAADSINYPIDMDALSALIDSLCDLTNNVNPPSGKEVVETEPRTRMCR